MYAARHAPTPYMVVASPPPPIFTHQPSFLSQLLTRKCKSYILHLALSTLFRILHMSPRVVRKMATPVILYHFNTLHALLPTAFTKITDLQ